MIDRFYGCALNGRIQRNITKSALLSVAWNDYGQEECRTLAVNARETMGGLFLANPCELNDEDCAGIFEKAYR